MAKSKGNIKLVNGEIIDIKGLGFRVPFVIIRALPLHVQVCEFIANQYYNYVSGSIEWKVLVNFLSMRSEKAKIVTAIILLSEQIKIAEINIPFMGYEFAVFFRYKILFLKTQKQQGFIDSSQVKSSLIKIFPYKFYYLLQKKTGLNYKGVIRSWVDDAEMIYPKEFKIYTILIYPFSLNIVRGIKYIFHCFKTYNFVTLMGIPYSFKKLKKVILSRNLNRDYAIIKYEIDSMQKHSKDLKKFDIIYTSDDFIPASPVLYQHLIDKIYIINNAHGIGFYNPYLIYNKMLVFNEAQKNYYALRNPEIEFIVKENKTKTDSHPLKTKNSVVVIIDQGNLEQYGLFYESNLQKKVNDKVIKICEQYGIRTFIKFHPNRKNKEKNKIIANTSLREVKDFKLMKSQNILFINLYSTSYFDFRKYGKFIFVREGIFDPKVYFGDEIQTVEYSKLEWAIKYNLGF